MAIVIYISTVSGNQTVRRCLINLDKVRIQFVNYRKSQQQITDVLTAKKVPFETVDVAADEKGKERMKLVSGKATVPQVHVDGKFKGVS
jgi:glutaredoxin